MIEYALILALVTIVGLAGLTLLSERLQPLLEAIAAQLTAIVAGL